MLKVLFRVTLSLSLAGLILVFSPHGVTSASGAFSIDTHVVYKVNGDTTAVAETYNVSNLTDRQYLTQIVLSTPVETISGVAAHYSGGTSIPVVATKQASTNSGITYNYQSLKLVFPQQLYGLGRAWSFSLSYNATGLTESHGGSHTVYVPAIQPNNMQGSYSVRVDVPASFGTPHFQGVSANEVSSGGGRQFFDFNKAGLVKQALALSFGDDSIYRVNFNFPLSNNGLISQIQTVTLPPKLNNQRVHIESLSPAPLNTHVDADGNVLADYRVGPGQHITVKTVITGQVNYLDYNLAASGKTSAIPADLVKQYTGATHYWQTGGAVGAQAKALSNPNAPVIDNVRAMYNFVVGHLTYNPNKIKFNVRQGAAKALANPTNVVCLEYSDLLIAMLRSQGIPARMPVGYGYSGSLKNSSSVVDSLHSWVEAYVPGIGWMTLDPTWGEKFDIFGQSDLDHFAFAVWGVKDQVPAPVMVGAQDAGYQYEQTTLSYANSVQTVPAGGTIKLVRRPLLPLVSIDQQSVTATGDQPGHYVASYDGKNHDLGTLAPGQHLTSYHWLLGGTWRTTGALALSETSGGQALIVARSTIQLDYRTMYGVVGVIAAGLILVIMVRFSPRRRKNQP